MMSLDLPLYTASAFKLVAKALKCVAASPLVLTCADGSALVVSTVIVLR
jgi:hypothetical protein